MILHQKATFAAVTIEGAALSGGTHPYVGNWWPPGHIVGYEHTFVHTIADFVNAVVAGKSVQPTFEDGMKNQRVLEAVEESAKSRQWVAI